MENGKTESDDNFGYGPLPETMEDLVEELELVEADIVSIGEQLEYDVMEDATWRKRALGARAIKRKHRAVLRGHRVWLEAEERREQQEIKRRNIEATRGEYRAKYHAVMSHLRDNHNDIWQQMCTTVAEIETEMRSKA